MYLLKQWRESRILSGLAVLGLALLLFLVVKGAVKANSISFNANNRDGSGFGMLYVPIFYIECVLIAFWGWLIASIGIGKNLGEDSGSFLFTRPRRRAWFLWSDWSYAMAQIAAILVLANLMIGLLLAHVLRIVYGTSNYHFPDGNIPTLPVGLLLVSVGVLLFAGLIYGLTYFSTILIKRTAGVMLGTGIFLGYLVLDGILHHYYAIRLPSPIMNVFDFGERGFHGVTHNLGANIAIRTVVMLAFPFAAQLILDHSEI